MTTQEGTMTRVPRTTAIVILAAVLLAGCGGETRSLEVSASAYNSVASQTSGQPNLAAWGDELKPGMKAIAVSPDLIDLGLGHGTVVTIEGLPGRYRVLDRTAARHTNRIDIYMGTDVEAAREWGVKTVTITWRVEE
jgi:3D (Asp-Asp-Asp) domain-containing protein